MIIDRMKKPGLICKILLLTVAMASSMMSVSAVNRYSVNSGNWGAASTWSDTPNGPPGAGAPDRQDDVYIQNGHTVTVTTDYECTSLTFTGAYAVLVVNSPATLTVKTIVSLNKQTSQNAACIVTGTGTLVCVGVDVGSDTNPPPIDASSSVYTHTFTSSIAYLSLSVKGAPKNDITITSYVGGTTHFRNGIFNHESGIISVDGQIVTSNSATGNTSVFSMETGVQSGTLMLYGRPSPFILSGTGTNVTSFNGSASLVNYGYAGAQTALPAIYKNITLSGSGAKTLTGVSVNGTLSMEGLATATGSAPVYNPLSALQYKGSAAQVTGIEFPPVFSGSGGVILNNSNGVSLNGNRSISSNLNFINGRLSTGTNTLNLASNATVTGAGAGKYVNGNLQKSIGAGTLSKTYEIGDATAYAPVNLSFTGPVNVEGSITARTTAGDHPNIASSTFNSGVTVNRYWTLTNSGVGGFISYNSIFNFVPGDVDTGADFNNFYVGNYNAAPWVYPAVGTLNALSTQATGLTSFGDFQIGELPVSSYRSRQSGAWDQISTWDAFNGTIWVPAVSTPTSTSGYITIRSSHTVSTTAPVTVDQLIIDPGGRLNVSTGLLVNDGPAIDFSVNGTLDCASGDLAGNGSFILNSFGDLIIRSADGITAAGVTGDIKTSIRTFSTWGNYTYSGTVSQVTGDGLPVSLNNLTIENPAGVTLSGSVSVNGTLILTSGVLNAGANTLTFMASNQPINRSSGTITTSSLTNLTFGSPGNQLGDPFTIPPGTFTGTPEINNFNIYRTSGITLNEQGLSLNGILLNNGQLNTSGNLTLLSTPSGTALIDGTGTGEITGDVTMQRYIPSAFGYKYLSSPFQSSTVGEFSDEIDLSASFPAFFSYNEGSVNSGWANYVTSTNILNPLHGFAANFGSQSVPVTADIKGVVNNGALSITLSNNNNAYTKGFNLTGNPYPSPINWDAPTGWTKTNIDNALYYFKSSLTDEYGGTYSTYINGISSDGLATGIIPSMQGFFVHVSDGSYPVTGTLSPDNTVRVTDLTHSLLKSEGKGSLVQLRIGATFGDVTTSTDPLVIYFHEKATTGFDGNLDALKLMNTYPYAPNFYSAGSDGTKLSINALPESQDTLCRIPLGINLKRDGFIIFKIEEQGEGLSGKKIFISDDVAGKQYDLLNGGEPKIYLKEGEYTGRFFLNLSAISTGVPVVRAENAMFSVYTANGVIKMEVSSNGWTAGNSLTISSVTGQVLLVKKNLNPGYHEFSPGLKDGIYIINFLSGKHIGSKKIFIQNR